MAIRCPDQFGSVRCKHGKAIEVSDKGDLLEVGAIVVDQIEMKRWSLSLTRRDGPEVR